MSIENNWKSMNQESDDELSSLLQPGRIGRFASKNPLQKIRFSLLVSSGWALLIAALYIYVMILFPYWQVILCIGIVFLFTVWAGISGFNIYRSIHPFDMGPAPLLEMMEKHYNAVQQWMRMQKKVALFVYPVAATGGFMIGGMVGSGKTIEEFFSKPQILVALLITLAVLVPACMLLARWMFRKSFGKYLDMLKRNIDELKSTPAPEK